MLLDPGDTEPERKTPWRWGVFFAGIWLVYLVSAVEAGWDRHDLRGWLGIAGIVAFAVVYLAVFVRVRMSRSSGGPFQMAESTPIGVLAVVFEAALGAGICAAVGQQGAATSVFVAVTAVMCLPRRWGWMVSVAVALVAYVASTSVPGWHSDTGTLGGTLLATVAMWGIKTAINRNLEVVSVREENARLAVVDERNRFARDLHDILGHSLTVITVKAELANRLLDVDQDRARAEIDDLERLSRDALADIRRAVEGYRELSLPGEIARARQALTAAQIQADLPNSTDMVPTDHRELFAWAVREGVTNVLRHSGAKRCCVRLDASCVEVCDDGRGPAGETTPGHGIIGLRERAAARGATVQIAPLRPGFSLKVAMPS